MYQLATNVGLILTKPGRFLFSGYGQTDTVLESVICPPPPPPPPPPPGAAPHLFLGGGVEAQAAELADVGGPGEVRLGLPVPGEVAGGHATVVAHGTTVLLDACNRESRLFWQLPAQGIHTI